MSGSEDKMNLMATFAVLLMSVIGAGGSEREPRVFLYSAEKLTEVNNIMLPNLGSETFQLIVSSPCELQFARIDSTEMALCLAERNLLEQIKGKAGHISSQTRWYTITWRTQLKVGFTSHTIYLTARSGKSYAKLMTISVEGNEKQEKPRRRQ